MRLRGIGVDIIKNSRMADLLKRASSERFMKKALHPNEISKLENLSTEQQKGQYLASRWAAKEALVKATNDKFLLFDKIEVRNCDNGSPYFHLEPENTEKLEPDFTLYLSISHEDEYSVAYVNYLTS